MNMQGGVSVVTLLFVCVDVDSSCSCSTFRFLSCSATRSIGFASAINAAINATRMEIKMTTKRSGHMTTGGREGTRAKAGGESNSKEEREANGSDKDDINKRILSTNMTNGINKWRMK